MAARSLQWTTAAATTLCILATMATVGTAQLSGHPTVTRPADLTPEVAQGIYDAILPQIASGYRAAGFDFIRNFSRWQRANTAPFRSATHGERFVNVYVNRGALAYLKGDPTAVLDDGAVIVKDGFTAMSDGALYPGPASVMTKEGGVEGGWRYILIMPDGSVLADSAGATRDATASCAACHERERVGTEPLFFVGATADR